jgi:hypothetical protein
MRKISPASMWVRGKGRPHIVGIAVSVAAFVIVGTILLIRSLAAGSSLTLVTTTQTAKIGDDYVVTLRMTPGTATTAVDSTITYDQTKLQFKSLDTSGSSFPAIAIAQGGDGKVNVVEFTTGTALSGDLELAKVTFTVIGSTVGSTTLTATGEAGSIGETDVTTVALTPATATLNIALPQTPQSASYTIEPTVAAPLSGSQFGLKVYANSDALYQGGEVIVNLPSGLAYTGTLDTTGTAFNPATTVTGTTAQSVHLVFVTQSTTMTGKKLVATIPVTASSTGDKSVTFSGARLADLNGNDITPMTANAFNITVNAASLPAPVLSIPGKSPIASTEAINDLKQTFTITNLDSAATYVVKLAGQTLPVTNGSFSIPSSMKNGDLALQVSLTKNGASGSANFTIRLRSPNVNRIACVELSDLLLTNKGYGGTSTELDLNRDGTVSVIDLLTVTANWGGACV